jgi:hypothetical protein
MVSMTFTVALLLAADHVQAWVSGVPRRDEPAANVDPASARHTAPFSPPAPALIAPGAAPSPVRGVAKGGGL